MLVRRNVFWSCAHSVLWGLVSMWQPIPAAAADPIQFLDPRAAEGGSSVVIVPDVPLAHTGQFLPIDAQGTIVGAGDVSAQVAAVLSQLDAASRLARTSSAPVLVKLHIVVTADDVAGQVRQILARRFSGGQGPAVTYVTGKLQRPGALVAMDAVYALPADASARGMLTSVREKPAAVAVLPPGPKVYVSGQAEQGKDLADMTRRTLESLAATLAHMQLDLDAVVQVKSFVGPFTAVAEAEQVLTEFFRSRGAVPPLVFVEWTTSPSIEIELVAAGGKQGPADGETVDFITPPGMTASPLFSRLARMGAGPSIYLAGLYGTSPQSGAAESREIYRQMAALLESAGSDLKHLVKATYYVSTAEASTKLNEVRPEFYDPKRPPAASKAPVPGTGRPGQTLTIDMIAAPRRK